MTVPAASIHHRGLLYRICMLGPEATASDRHSTSAISTQQLIITCDVLIRENMLPVDTSCAERDDNR